MLLSKMVNVKWGVKTKKYYEEKGYTYTGIGSDFGCKIEDLTNGSKTLVNVKCDCPDCKDPYLKPMTWKDYNRYLREDGKYYCLRCAKQLFGYDKMSETYLKRGMSFSYYVIKNLYLKEAIGFISRWDYELNDKNPNEVNYTTHKKYWFKCPRGIHKSELKDIAEITVGHGKRGCNQCNSFGQYLLDTYGENALELYWDYEKNIGIDPWNVSRRGNTKVWIKCTKTDYHGSYCLSPDTFIGMNCRCPYCSNQQIHKLDSIAYSTPQILNIWSDKNIKTPYEYSEGSNKKVWWKCTCGKHKDYLREINTSKRFNFRCPKCVEERDESILQEKIRLYLESLEYSILHEHKCSIRPRNPKNNHLLPLDNEVKELNLIIECHGIQHYEISGFHKKHAKRNSTTPEYEFHMQKVRDRYKKIYAHIQGYHYLEIPFWTDNDAEEYKQLIDNKIQEILSQQSQSA